MEVKREKVVKSWSKKTQQETEPFGLLDNKGAEIMNQIDQLLKKSIGAPSLKKANSQQENEVSSVSHRQVTCI